VINKSGPTFRQPKGLGLPVAAALGTLGGQCFDLAEGEGELPLLLCNRFGRLLLRVQESVFFGQERLLRPSLAAQA
jgi:hypothetical protein